MLLHTKGNQQGERQPSEWEKIIANETIDRINFQNAQAAHTAQCQKNKQPNQKVGERPKRHFSKEDIQMANQLMKDAQHHSLLKNCKLKLQ